MIFQQICTPAARLECSWWDWQLPAAPVEFGMAPHEPWKQTHALPNPMGKQIPGVPAALCCLHPKWEQRPIPAQPGREKLTENSNQ